MVDTEKILAKYSGDNEQLLHLLIAHNSAVAQKSLAIAYDKNLNVDRDFVYEAAMLHDIGVVKCDAPSIFCFGIEPYIRHGVEGRLILEKEGLPRHALVCERHTGAGITKLQIIEQNLPLPHRDMLPVTLEEKLICYADKFFSKSRRPDEEKPVERIISQMEAHGRDSLERFMELQNLFGK